FVELGGFFVTFVSGNTTQLGDALATGIAPVAVLTGSLIGLFFVGSFAGASLALLPARWATSAVLVLVLVAMIASMTLSVTGFTPAQAMLALAVAAGAQNAILTSQGAVRLGATFVTGTMFGAAQDLAKALRRLAPPWRWLQHLLVWISLLSGAALGALAHRSFGTYALAAPFAIYLAFLVAFTLFGPRSVQT
ncbi:MAG TPA: YoaK family protein, partial [Devosia sp.]|nr:YoaK family protein [Devosia sp.]